MSTEIRDAFVNVLLAHASYAEGLSAGDQDSALRNKLAPKLTEKSG